MEWQESTTTIHGDRVLLTPGLVLRPSIVRTESAVGLLWRKQSNMTIDYEAVQLDDGDFVLKASVTHDHEKLEELYPCLEGHGRLVKFEPPTDPRAALTSVISPSRRTLCPTAR